MNPNFKENERELVKLVNHFRKRAESLVKEGKLSQEHMEVSKACERLIEKLDMHATGRAEIMQKREALKNLVKDNAQCPQCNSVNYLKYVKEVTHEKGWKNNRYRCRRCNIEFTWNRPNNPWDMIVFMENVMSEMEAGLSSMPEETALQTQELITQMEAGLNQLKTVIEASDEEYEEFNKRDKEMSKMINDFKAYLLIEKIKMDTWNSEVGES